MRRIALVPLLLTLGVTAAHAQGLTADQRDADLTQRASTYAKNYAPYEWKRDVIGFDLVRLTPWLQRVHKTDDLDFEEALVDYIASLNDAHVTITFPSNFSASLGFTVDIYDGKVLIDSVNRTALPAAQLALTRVCTCVLSMSTAAMLPSAICVLPTPPVAMARFTLPPVPPPLRPVPATTPVIVPPLLASA